MKKQTLLFLGLFSINIVLAQSPERIYWYQTAYKIAYPVLKNLSEGKLKARMPVEATDPASRAKFAPLEALGRTLCGLAPWLELGPDTTAEGKIRQELLMLARQGIRHAVDPESPDYMNFSEGKQPLVDAAFLAQAFLRAPHQLWENSDPATRQNIIRAFRQTRRIRPNYSNWLLFSATIEAFFLSIGEEWDAMRIEFALSKHEDWYKGDGVYGDGPDFHWDYYNSFVIQPMLLDIAGVLKEKKLITNETYTKILNRAIRYAEIQERLISPEGTFPALGRSLAYRTGCLQVLSHITLMHRLPENITPAQVRCALTQVTKRMFSAPGTFDSGNWLRIGFAGHQPCAGEEYICTGSLYLCTTGFLHLGLPPDDEFWTAPDTPWTNCKAWKGETFPIDHAR